MQRGSGILLAISSLPGSWGIGTLGRGARDFLDQLCEAGQRYWQVLPASPTGYGDSPYQAASVFAGNPYFIDFEELAADGLTDAGALPYIQKLLAADARFADYGLQFAHKPSLLREVFLQGGQRYAGEVAAFERDNAYWLGDYALYMALKSENAMKPFGEWPLPLAQREPRALTEAADRLAQEVRFHIFQQYVYHRQWGAVRRYARERGIAIIGDMPIYVAPDSADAWARPDLLDKQGRVAGCPPDYFCETGQLWGNPVYDWDALKAQGYEWWVQRVAHQMKLYDFIRVDHFRGFASFYAIPADEHTAEKGEWVKGPGMALFARLREALGQLPLIAEDLGCLTPEVFALLKETGFPGLKVLQFAFDPSGESIYLPHRYERNCVVYTGTHDNDTTEGWYVGLDEAQRAFLREYIGLSDDRDISRKLMRIAMASVADVCITPMQDVLGLGSWARMNKPQTAQGNWRWRLEPGAFDAHILGELKRMAALYGR